MFSKLLTAGSLEDLEKKVGSYLSELNNRGPALGDSGGITAAFQPIQVLKIYHVHSFITQEVGKTSTITANGPGREVITKFSLMIIAGYE